MKLFNLLINNKLYFWLLFISLTLISYVSIFQGLVLNKSYSLIIPYLAFNVSFFLLIQLILIFSLRTFFYSNIEIFLEKTTNIVFIFLFSFLITYLLISFNFYI